MAKLIKDGNRADCSELVLVPPTGKLSMTFSPPEEIIELRPGFTEECIASLPFKSDYLSYAGAPIGQLIGYGPVTIEIAVQGETETIEFSAEDFSEVIMKFFSRHKPPGPIWK